MVYYRKSDFPEKDELVICTVKQISTHAAFCTLDEYDNKEGMLHISEMSSTWVKNVRKFVAEGKQIVCKVLDVNTAKGHIDLSLKRVSNVERDRKFSQWGLEKKTDKLLQIVEERLKKKSGSYHEIGDAILNKYGALYLFYEDMLKNGTSVLDSITLPKEWTEAISSIIEDHLKSQQVYVTLRMQVSSFAGDGAHRISSLFKIVPENIEVKYVGASKYSLIISAVNYKSAEERVRKVTNKLEEESKKLDLKFSWERIK